MLRIWCVLSLVCYLVLFSSNSRDVDSSRFTTVKPEIKVQEFTSTAFLYERLNLDTILPFHAFEQAHRGYQNVKNMDRPILSIIDFTKPSTDKRMVVLNMEKEEVLFHTIVSHGRNSGDNYARSFSNRHGSYQSSLGFYLTADTYMGGNGYSLVLEGLEEGINDQAKARAIVIHGADYCSEDFIRQTGRLGRSYGCPALPRAVNRAIIDTIKKGSLLYIYADDKKYAQYSAFINEAASTETNETVETASRSLPSTMEGIGRL